MKSADFVALVSSYVGRAGYWYGCFIPMVGTESLLSQKAAQYPKTYTEEYKTLARKWLGKPVADCVGLLKGCIWVGDYGGKYQAASDLSADGFFAKCTEKGPLSTIPEIPGLLLHKPGHIGMYKGGGKVVESVGVHSGVIESNLADRGWTEWGKCYLVAYDSVPPPPVTDWQAECIKKDAEIAELKTDLAKQTQESQAKVFALAASLDQANIKIADLEKRISDFTTALKNLTS